MQPTICARCKKNMAVIFISKIEGGETVNEGLCLKCARELHIKPVDDIMAKMGISDEDLDTITNEMSAVIGGTDISSEPENTDMPEDESGKTATFPYLNRLFGADSMFNPLNNAYPQPPQPYDNRSGKSDTKEPYVRNNAKLKFLNNYCINLTERASEGLL
ncbi:MAG: ATP-dependent Clp protease ATP-binding subunit, partial [Oscillospiraceae bacterium]